MMNSAATPSIFDAQSLAALKKGLRRDDPQALKAAAQQFEAVFLQMMLKSMRATVPQDGPFDSDATRFYQELLDSQLAQVMASRGGTGLAKVIERQLSQADRSEAALPVGGLPLSPPVPARPLAPVERALPLSPSALPTLPLGNSPVQPGASLPETDPRRSFIATVWPDAVAAARQTGVPAQFLVAHAALESGWGKAVPRHTDGRSSNNLFGIKAGSNWQGASVAATTTEFLGGAAERRVERFRAYASHAEAFQDYARLLAQSPRYAAVLGSQDAAGFARGLQRAGYATDPDYAAKLERVIGGLAQLTATSALG